jgi:AcrR family transcriptional regulator
MPRTEQAYEEIREITTNKILEAAGKVIARKGRTATMAELAAEAGVSQGLAYRYFSSKEEIFYELLRQMMRSGGIINEDARKTLGSPRERLEAIISGTIRLRREHPEFYQFVFQALIDEKLPRDIRQAMKDHDLGAREVMRQLIVEGQAGGEITEDDPDQLVDAIMACLDGLSRKMASLSSDEAKAQLPEARIILRMLGPH